MTTTVENFLKAHRMAEVGHEIQFSIDGSVTGKEHRFYMVSCHGGATDSPYWETHYYDFTTFEEWLTYLKTVPNGKSDPRSIFGPTFYSYEEAVMWCAEHFKNNQ